MHVQSCCFTYSTFFDVLIVVAVVASFRTPFYKRVYMFSYCVDGFSTRGGGGGYCHIWAI